MGKVFKLQLPIIAILLLATILRLWGINFGLPQIQIGDEGGLIGASMYAGTHALRPLRLIYGQLVPYLLLLEYGIYFSVAVLFGKFATVFDMYVSFIKDPRDLVLIGRFTMAGVGVLIVWLTYYVGKKFYNKRVGLVAAFFLSITFLSVKESHYLKEGNLAALFSLSGYYFILKIQQEATFRNYLGAGITLGLAVGAKFEPLLMLPIFLLSHFLKNKKLALKKLGFFIIGFSLAILMTFPYLFISPNAYLKQLLLELGYAQINYPLHLLGKPVWWWFLSIHIPQGLGLPLFFAAVIGFIISIGKSKSNRNYFFIPLVPIIFLATIDYLQKLHAARYALLTLPFYALGAAIFVEWITSIIKNKHLRLVVFLSCIGGLSFVSVFRSIKFNTIITRPDTRFISKSWIEKNIPAGARVLVETTIKPEYQANINVPLILDPVSLTSRIQQAHDHGFPGTYLEALKVVTSGQTGYNLVATPRVDVAKNTLTDKSTSLIDASYWVDQNVNYLVLSSWAVKPDLTDEFEKSINEYYDLLKEFRPNPEFRQDPHFIQMDYQALDGINVLSHDLIFGPVIQIYKLKERIDMPSSDPALLPGNYYKKFAGLLPG